MASHADESEEVPDGAAVFPDIPAELNINPLLLSVLHTVVFLAGSADGIVQEAAADEALAYIAGYMQRLTGPDLQRTKEDIGSLRDYAKAQNWSKGFREFLKTFLDEFGVGKGRS